MTCFKLLLTMEHPSVVAEFLMGLQQRLLLDRLPMVVRLMKMNKRCLVFEQETFSALSSASPQRLHQRLRPCLSQSSHLLQYRHRANTEQQPRQPMPLFNTPHGQ